MQILELLEHLATNIHSRINEKELIATQSYEIQQAFLQNDAMQLKRELGDAKNLADKNTIFIA